MQSGAKEYKNILRNVLNPDIKKENILLCMWQMGLIRSISSVPFPSLQWQAISNLGHTYEISFKENRNEAKEGMKAGRD